MKDRKQNIFLKWINYIWNIIFSIIIIVVVLISMIIIYKSIRYPDKIPDIFGYKPFIVLDEYMDDSIEYGDLVITKIVDTSKIEKDNLVAFRNNENIVTIHKIIDIFEINDKKTFTMKTSENETLDTKFVSEDNIEGIVIRRIAKVGSFLMFMQEPLVLFILIIIILIIGLIAYFIADKIDKKEKN